MTASISPVKAPFQNLKFVITINKIFGLVSCKLVNGRLKLSSIWARGYCALWILFHCVYISVNYYRWYIILAVNRVEIFFFLNILRYNNFFASLYPYHYVAAFRNKNIIKFSDKLETYDDRAMVLGYRRKDKHIFIWLYFTYTLIMLIMKTHFTISANIEQGTVEILKTIFENIIPIIIGTYCVFITVIFLDLIRQRFRHLNNMIIPHVSELPVTGSQGEITVYDVRYLHGVLIDSAELIDSLYGFGTFFTFTSMLVEFVSVIYILIENMDNDNSMVTILDLSFQTIYLFAMYHFTALEANRVEENIEKYGLSFQNPKCRMDKIEMMLYFYHARFYFTAANFFVLDLTIFLSIFSTVATLITIIV